ncbi:hypothetical protein CVIRNUC_003176 [Coccomyxa viridis]|uniref:Glutamine amidotransferase type-2 domain-containing protein n=1 Tax=Coccomyxa viridis TaxID=1274662 RepID=A0AAV1HXW4_9CHLO|nr:hypothetical protein CVIRNUC_003176 [Coccomyxa viridis]
MCGILFLYRSAESSQGKKQGIAAQHEPVVERFLPGLQSRGPDAQSSDEVRLRSGATLVLQASLLQLRGRTPTTPVHKDSSGNILLFNGEIFGGLDVPGGRNDAQALLEALSAPGADVAAILTALRGPWAILYWQAASQTAWLGRDPIGRRSLLLHHPSESCPDLIVSSRAEQGASVATAVPQHHDASLSATVQDKHAETPAEAFWQEVEPGCYSIAFGNPRLLEGRIQVICRHDSKQLHLQRIVEYKHDQHLLDCSRSSGAEHQPGDLERACQQVLSALQRAVDIRCHSMDFPAPARSSAHSLASGQEMADAPVLVLFSGGVDSTLLAALAHRSLPESVPIDLASICFDGGQSPDRQSAIDALAELRKYAPNRQWRLIQVAGSLVDMDSNRSHLLDLLCPADTVMDLNIGAALWLAAQAQGTLHGQAGHDRQYRSAARVVLLGHGADELCAGYGRHRTTFRHQAWEGLSAELSKDMSRLWRRNLGRDDRIIADTGREARHPFLDEQFIETLLGLPLPLIADLRLPPGTGDKQLLRMALLSLGLPRTAARVKRAIQFGSRLSKRANIRDFGSNRAANVHKAGELQLDAVAQGRYGPGPKWEKARKEH